MKAKRLRQLGVLEDLKKVWRKEAKTKQIAAGYKCKGFPYLVRMKKYLNDAMLTETEIDAAADRRRSVVVGATLGRRNCRYNRREAMSKAKNRDRNKICMRWKGRVLEGFAW